MWMNCIPIQLDPRVHTILGDWWVERGLGTLTKNRMLDGVPLGV